MYVSTVTGDTTCLLEDVYELLCSKSRIVVRTNFETLSIRSYESGFVKTGFLGEMACWIKPHRVSAVQYIVRLILPGETDFSVIPCRTFVVPGGKSISKYTKPRKN